MAAIAIPALGRRPRPRLGGLRRYLGVVLCFAAWALGSATGILPARDLPAPWDVASAGADLIRNGTLIDALLISLRRVAIGLSLGVAAGTALALVAGLSALGNDLVNGPVQMFRSLPVLALTPLFIVWFGIGEQPKVYLIALATTFPVYLNLYGGIRAVDPKLIESARSLGLSRAALIRDVVLPSSMASFLIGLRYSTGVAWLVLVVSEQVNAQSGIGYLMIDAANYLRTDIIVLGLVVYAVLGLISDALIRLIEERVLAWRA